MIVLITTEDVTALVDRLAAEVKRLRAEEVQAKLDAKINRLGDGYWQTRWNAEQKLEAARKLAEAME